MGDGSKKINLAPASTLPQWNWGFDVGPFLSVPVETLVSEGGFGGGICGNIAIPDSFKKSELIDLCLGYSSTDARLYSDADFSEGMERTRTFMSAGWGRKTRNYSWFDNSGVVDGSVFSASIPYFGFSLANIDFEKTSSVEGEEYGYSGSDGKTLDVGQRIIPLGLEIITNGGTLYSFFPEIVFGFHYEDNPSDFNGTDIQFRFNVAVGSPDDISSSNDEITGVDIGNYAYRILHGLVSTLVSDAVVGAPQQIISDSGIFGSDEQGQVNMSENAAVLSGISSFFAAISGSDTAQGFVKADGGLRWLFPVLQGLRGAVVLGAAESTSGTTSGTGDLLSAAGLIVYPLFFGWDVDLDDGMSQRPDLIPYAFLTRSLLNTAIFLLGSVFEDDTGKALRGASVQANAQLSSEPDPSSDPDVKKSFFWIPVAGYSAGESNGNLGGIGAHADFAGFLFGETRLVTSAFLPGNAVNTVSQDELYDYPFLPSVLSSSLGAEYLGDYVRAGGGLDFSLRFGGGDADTGIGTMAFVDGKIPVKDDYAVIIGLYASLRKLVGDEGSEMEGGPRLGLAY